MTVFERVDDRAIVLLSSGNLAGTQAVISVLKQRGDAKVDAINLWTREQCSTLPFWWRTRCAIERRGGQYLAESAIKFNASFILGGQIGGEPLRLFRIYAEGNFVEAGLDTRMKEPRRAATGR